MEHSEEYYKMKYFKYKAKYTKEKQRIEQSGGVTLVGQAIVGTANVVYEGVRGGVNYIGTKVGNLFKSKSKEEKEEAKQKKLETKQQALAAALKFLTDNSITVKDNTDYKEIKNAITNFKGGDKAIKEQILKNFEVCRTMNPFKKIDNECIDLKNK
jgi:hypothetical protein